MPELLAVALASAGDLPLCTGLTAKLLASSSSKDCSAEGSRAKPHIFKAHPINHPQYSRIGFETGHIG